MCFCNNLYLFYFPFFKTLRCWALCVYTRARSRRGNKIVSKTNSAINGMLLVFQPAPGHLCSYIFTFISRANLLHTESSSLSFCVNRPSWSQYCPILLVSQKLVERSVDFIDAFPFLTLFPIKAGEHLGEGKKRERVHDRNCMFAAKSLLKNILGPC
jgi:hypothetical protein